MAGGAPAREEKVTPPPFDPDKIINDMLAGKSFNLAGLSDAQVQEVSDKIKGDPKLSSDKQLEKAWTSDTAAKAQQDQTTKSIANSGPGVNPFEQGQNSALTQGIEDLQKSKNPFEVGVGQLAQTFDLTDAAGLAGKNFSVPGHTAPGDATKPPGGGGGSTTPPPTTNPWEDLTNQLVQSYAGSINALNPIASGQTLASTDAAMSSNAETMLGAGSGSPMAQYLNANTAAAQAQSAGTTAAVAAESAGNDAGSAQIGKALQGLGQAETQQMAGAPYQQLLQALAAEVPYKLSSGTIPSLSGSEFSKPWLTAAETAAGVPNVSATTGTSLPGAPTPSLPNPTSVATPASPAQTQLDTPSYSFSQGQ